MKLGSSSVLSIGGRIIRVGSGRICWEICRGEGRVSVVVLVIMLLYCNEVGGGRRFVLKEFEVYRFGGI